MKEINIPVGISDFKEICKNGYYYVDKTFLRLQRGMNCVWNG